MYQYEYKTPFKKYEYKTYDWEKLEMQTLCCFLLLDLPWENKKKKSELPLRTITTVWVTSVNRKETNMLNPELFIPDELLLSLNSEWF